MARPRLNIDPKQVELLAGVFCTNEEIAAKIGCSSDTLTRRFAEAIEKGRESAKASLRAKQFHRAMSGSDTMLIWLGKQYLDQKDKTAQEVTGKDGGPIEHRNADEEAILAAADEIKSRRASLPGLT